MSGRIIGWLLEELSGEGSYAGLRTDLSEELGAKVCKYNRSDVSYENLLGVATDCI